MANNIRNMVNTLQTVPESQTTDHVTNNATANNQTTAPLAEVKTPAPPTATASLKARTSSAAAAAAKVSHILLLYIHF
jgi:hypothetical protein